MKNWRSSWSARHAATALIVLSFLLGCVQLYWNVFVDEGDNIATGVQLAHGQTLYGDVFSHHFPLPYYWVALVTRCAGASMLSFRVSILAYQTAAFAATAWLTPFPLAISMVALVWRAIVYPYYGNLLIYSNFTGPALLGVSAITLAAASTAMRLRPLHAIALGVLSAIAISADPLAVYPVFASVVVLSLNRRTRASAVTSAAIIAAFLAVYMAYLLATGTFSGFWSDAIRFNAGVYRKYRGEGPLPLGRMLATSFNLLDVFDRRWWHLSLSMADVRRPDEWIASGLFYRIAMLLGAITLFLRRRIASSFYLYVTAAVLLGAFGDARFRAIPFVLLALFVASVWVTGECELLAATRRGRGLVWIARAYLGTSLLWLLVSGVGNMVAQRRNLTYAANFGGYEQRARVFRRLACGRTDVALSYYPADPLNHLFSAMPPASRYVVMLPWVAEVGIDDTIRALQDKPAVVAIELNGEIWGAKNRDYLAPLIDFLRAHYVEELSGIFVSPMLAAQCPLDAPALPHRDMD